VDLVPIQFGEGDRDRHPTTQQDLDASLEACPPPSVGRITLLHDLNGRLSILLGGNQ